MRSHRLHRDGVERLARRHKQPVAPGAAEAEVGADFREQDLPDPLALWGEDMYAVVAFAGPARARPDIAVGIRPDAIGQAGQLAATDLHLHRSVLAAVF